MVLKEDFKIRHPKRFVFILVISLIANFFLIGERRKWKWRYHMAVDTQLRVTSHLYSSPSPSPWISTYESPYDDKEIIVRGESYEEYLFLKDKGEERKLMLTMHAYNIQFSPKSSKIAFTDHIVSNQDVVYIVDLAIGNHRQAEGQTQYVQSQKGPWDYTHVYSYNIGWYDDDRLIIEVSGHPDMSNFRPLSQLFLINAKTGKVIRRLL